MKIALYAASWPVGSASNGIVTYTSKLVPALRQLGHTVFVLTWGDVTSDDPHTIDLRRYASASNQWGRVLARLAPAHAGFHNMASPITSAIRMLVETQSLDIFEMEESGGWSFAISRLKLLPVVVRLHGPWFLNGRFNDPNENSPLNRRREKWEGRGIQDAQLVTTPSAEILEAVKNRYNLSLPESRTIPNPIETEPKPWDITTCTKDSILFVGRFNRRKGGDLVLHAFAELAHIYPTLKLIFVGPDNGIVQADGKVSSFEHYVQNSLPDSCRSRIEFRGPMGNSSVMSLRRKYFAAIIASQYEIMPYSVLEAMSAGSPLVSTAVGGIPELIQDEQNGLLVPPRDPNALVAACRKLLDDHDLAARLGRKAWQDCRDRYAPHEIAKQTIGAYEATIEEFKHRRRLV